jgi:large subunit ribosomal protein L13
MREQLERQPQKIIFDAVNGMIPKTRLGGAQMKKLRVYAGPDHPHMAQKPKVLKLQESRYE